MMSNLRIVALGLLPFFTPKMKELLERIGVPYSDDSIIQNEFKQEISQFTVKEKGEPLYMRIKV